MNKKSLKQTKKNSQALPSSDSSTNQKSSIDLPEHSRIQNWAGIIYTLVSACIIIAGSYLAIRWAKGDFRIDESNQSVSKETGLLHATSTPQGAQVYINGNLTSATDDILYLSPGEYDVVIKKDGYSPWQKTVKIEQALVTQASATLYPYSPSLTSITYTGAQNLSISPDNQKLLYFVDANSADNKNGLYILDLANTSKNPQQISDNDSNYDLSQAYFIWSSDSSEVLVFTPSRIFLLKTNSFTNLQSSPDVSLQLTTILNAWEADLAVKEKQYLDQLPIAALQTILQNGNNFYLSSDHQKLIYTATSSASLADNFIAPLPASNNYPEQRQLAPNGIFIYDGYEDKNFLINQEASASSTYKHLLADVNDFIINAPPLTLSYSLQGDTQEETIANFGRYYGGYAVQAWQWLPDSTHLVGIQDDKIVIINYDGTNPTVVYSGPLAEKFVVPSPDGNRIFILTSFNPDSPANIYAIELSK